MRGPTPWMRVRVVPESLTAAWIFRVISSMRRFDVIDVIKSQLDPHRSGRTRHVQAVDQGFCPFGGQRSWCSSGNEFTDQPMKPAHRLCPRRNQLMAPVRQQLQCHHLIVGTHHPQVFAVQPSPPNRHRVGYGSVAGTTIGLGRNGVHVGTGASGHWLAIP